MQPRNEEPQQRKVQNPLIEIWSEWQDFWAEFSTYLCQKDFYELSCTSSSLNAMVWSEIIPKFGLTFGSQPQQTAALSNYLSRTPTLALLNLAQLRAPLHWDPHGVFRPIKILKHLVLPRSHDPASPLTWDWSFFSHLTTLEILESQKVPHESLPILETFNNLKSLRFEADPHHAPTLQTIARLTQLESLSMQIISNRALNQYEHLSSLTNLRHFEKITSEGSLSRVFNFFGHWTKIRSLALSNLPVPANISRLTNLTHLNLFKMKPTDTHRAEDYMQLTNLTCLVNMFEPDCAPWMTSQISKLTNLRKMVLNGWAIAMDLDCLAAFPNLPNLTTVECIVNPTHQPETQSSLWAQVTSLTDLHLELPTTSHLSVMTRLKSLFLPFQIKDAGTSHISQLTNLTSMSVYRLPLPWQEEIRCLTNLTKLHTKKDVNDVIPRLDVLTNLRVLEVTASDLRDEVAQRIPDILPGLHILKVAFSNGVSQECRAGLTRLKNLQIDLP